MGESAADLSLPAREADSEEALPGFLESVRARLIHLPSMDRALRLVTGMALAQLAACAALLAAARLPSPTLPVGIAAGSPVSVPAWIFVFVVGLLALAWTYLLGGALHAHPVVRLVALGFFLVLRVGAGAVENPAYPLAARLSLVVSVLGVAGVTAYTLQHDWRHSRRQEPHLTYGQRLRAPTFLLLGALVFAGYLGPGLSAGAAGMLHNFVLSIALEFSFLAIAVTFVLVLAGVDFADMGEAAGERLGVLARRLGGPWGLAGLTLVAALAILAGAVHRAGWKLPSQLIVAALFGAAIFGVSRLARVDSRWPRRLPYLALVAASVLIFVTELFFILILLLRPGAAEEAGSAAAVGPTTVYVQSEPPVYSLRVPAAWQSTPLRYDDAGITAAIFSGAATGDPGLFYVVSLPKAAAGDLQRALETWLRVCCPRFAGSSTPQGTAAHGAWAVAAVDIDLHNGGPHLPGKAWFKIAGGTAWLLYGLSPEYANSINGPAFQAMVDSWSPTITPAPEAEPEPAHNAAVPAGTQVSAYLSLTWLMFALVGLVVLATRRGRSGGRPGMMATLVFLVVGGLLLFAESTNQIASTFGLPEESVPHLGLAGLQASVAIATLAWLAWLGFRRRGADATRWLLPLVTLNMGLQVVAWMIDLYSATQAVTFSLAQGLLLLVAITWDVTLSGSSTTNVHGRWFPRHARVLLFFGYEVLTATCIVFYSSLKSPGGAPELFVSDVWPQAGLALLGLPLLLSVFVLRLPRPSPHGGPRS